MHTYYLLQIYCFSGHGAHLERNLRTTERNGRTHTSSHATPRDYPNPPFAHGRTDRHTIIDTHYVLGIFGTDTWTNGARACDLLFVISWFLVRCCRCRRRRRERVGWTGVLGFVFSSFLAFSINFLEFESAAFTQLLSSSRALTYLWFLPIVCLFYNHKFQGHLWMTTRGHRVSIWRKTGFALRRMQSHSTFD